MQIPKGMKMGWIGTLNFQCDQKHIWTFSVTKNTFNYEESRSTALKTFEGKNISAFWKKISNFVLGILKFVCFVWSNI